MLVGCWCGWLVLLCVGLPTAVASQTCRSHSLSPSLKGPQSRTIDSAEAVVLRAAALRCKPLQLEQRDEVEFLFDETWHSCFVWFRWGAICFHPGNLGGFVFCYGLPWSPGLLVVFPQKSLGKKALDLLGLGGFPPTLTEPVKNVGCLVEGLLAGVSDRLGSVVGILLVSATPSDRDTNGQASRRKDPSLVEIAAVKTERLGCSQFSSSRLSSIPSRLLNGGGNSFWKKLNGRKKINSAQQTADIARHLIGMLKQCLNHAASLDVLEAVETAGNTAAVDRQAPKKKRKQIDASGRWTWLKDEPPPQKQVNWQPQGQPKPQSSGKLFEARASRWITVVRAADWETCCPPRLVLLVEIWGPKVLNEIKTLLFRPEKKPLAAVLCGRTLKERLFPVFFPGGNLAEKSNMWLCLLSVKIRALGFRRLGKLRQRKGHPHSGHSNLGWPPSEFCGGRWTEQEKPKVGSQLVTVLRLKDSLVDTLVQKSGEHGFFCAEMQKQASETQAFWAQRESQESGKTYRRRVIAFKKEREQPVIFRFGFPKKTGILPIEKPEGMRCTMSLELGGKKKPANF